MRPHSGNRNTVPNPKVWEEGVGRCAHRRTHAGNDKMASNEKGSRGESLLSKKGRDRRHSPKRVIFQIWAGRQARWEGNYVAKQFMQAGPRVESQRWLKKNVVIGSVKRISVLTKPGGRTQVSR